MGDYTRAARGRSTGWGRGGASLVLRDFDPVAAAGAGVADQDEQRVLGKFLLRRCRAFPEVQCMGCLLAQENVSCVLRTLGEHRDDADRLAVEPAQPRAGPRRAFAVAGRLRL